MMAQGVTEATSDGGLDLEGLRILLVEDEADANRYFQLALREEGFEVEGVESGAESLDRLTEDGYGLVLLDIMMVGMDGIETCRRIRQDLGLTDLPICMITASMDVEKVVSAFQAGADGYIVKPFDIDELLSKIRELARA